MKRKFNLKMQQYDWKLEARLREKPNSIFFLKERERLTLLTMKSERSCAVLKSYSLYDLNKEESLV
jgi:hypothetical protein